MTPVPTSPVEWSELIRNCMIDFLGMKEGPEMHAIFKEKFINPLIAHNEIFSFKPELVPLESTNSLISCFKNENIMWNASLPYYAS